VTAEEAAMLAAVFAEASYRRLCSDPHVFGDASLDG
jgi:hypothetical protein